VGLSPTERVSLRWTHEQQRLAQTAAFWYYSFYIERAYGNVHDKCTRNHTRQRLDDVEEHLTANGPCEYKLSEIYYAPEVELELDVLHIRAA